MAVGLSCGLRLFAHRNYTYSDDSDRVVAVPHLVVHLHAVSPPPYDFIPHTCDTCVCKIECTM